MSVRVDRFEGDRPNPRTDSVAREEPLEIQLGSTSLAVVMRTPGHDDELALGFLVTERVVSHVEQVMMLRHSNTASGPRSDGNVMRVLLAPEVEVDLDALRRNLYASSSCGICGKATIENALSGVEPLNDRARFSAEYFYSLPSELEKAQRVFERTGGVHAAGIFDGEGRLLVVREDVGRHNAVDKVIGWALREGRIPLAGCVLMVSGRVSFEVVQKALVARLPVVAAVSAPSSLAVEFAEDAGLTLVGFLRKRGLNVYGNTSRIAAPSHS
ncbi:formate dehydrogenase accessory sulfurtransferase FdhD [Myxococcota bacterium]|nr:formate dehydrogenase accessory sulfurtransferase FdhD [Myxococcota bacterium]